MAKEKLTIDEQILKIDEEIKKLQDKKKKLLEKKNEEIMEFIKKNKITLEDLEKIIK